MRTLRARRREAAKSKAKGEAEPEEAPAAEEAQAAADEAPANASDEADVGSASDASGDNHNRKDAGAKKPVAKPPDVHSSPCLRCNHPACTGGNHDALHLARRRGGRQVLVQSTSAAYLLACACALRFSLVALVVVCALLLLACFNFPVPRTRSLPLPACASFHLLLLAYFTYFTVHHSTLRVPSAATRPAPLNVQ